MLDAASNPHYPKPDEEGIQAVIKLVKEKTGKEPSHYEAHQIFYRVMRHLYLPSFPGPVDGKKSENESFRKE